MKNRILITRPKNQAAEIADFLQKNGFEVVVEPLFDVKIVENVEKIDKNAVKSVILSSLNAIPVFLAQNFDKNVRIFVVGKKTAQKLLENGYKNVFFAQKMGFLALKELILAQNLSKNEKILYFCGNFVSFDFSADLIKQGYDSQKILSYEIDYKNRFSADFLQKNCQKPFDFVLIFSTKAAQNFYELSKKHNLLEYFKNSVIICLSEKIADEIAQFGFKNVQKFEDFLILKNFYEL